MEEYKKLQIVKIKDRTSGDVSDFIAEEKRLRISVNGQNILNLYCTPSMIRELVVGLVYDEGLITGEWCADRISIVYGDEIQADIPSSGTISEGERTITSGCAGGISFVKGPPDRKITDSVTFKADDIRKVFREFQSKSEIFRITGAVHSASLTDGKHILAFAEDIGRHNAVDKVIGYCILEHIPFEKKIMLASGRLSSEIVLKCYKSGIPVVISRAAPTSLAVEIAESAGITLIGFMRGDRMNVYTGDKRVISEGEDLIPHNNDLKAQ